jgi:hypothetical protein
MFLALISKLLIIFSSNYPLKFCLPEFSPGGYYSGTFHQNPFSIGEFSEPGAGWEENRACLLLCSEEWSLHLEAFLAKEPAGLARDLILLGAGRESGLGCVS